MVARAFVVNVTENALDRIGLRAIAWQPNKFEAGMLFKPVINRLRFMNAVIVANDINLSIAFAAGLLEMVQQPAEQKIVFVRPQDVINPPRGRIERRGQIVFLILAWSPDFKLGAFEHPLPSRPWGADQCRVHRRTESSRLAAGFRSADESAPIAGHAVGRHHGL